MKRSGDSLDVFEFQEEDELTEMAAKRFSIKSRSLTSLDRGTKDLANKKMPGLSNIQHAHSTSQEQCAEIRYTKLEHESLFPSLGCTSNVGAVSHAKDHSDCAFLESSLKDESAGMTSVADENIGERSPSHANAEDDDSSDGSSSKNFFDGWDMGAGRSEIVFYPDYVDYLGVHYLHPVVTFSRSTVEVKSKTVYGSQETFAIQLEINDIVGIVSQWSAQHETGTIIIRFISEDAVQDEIDCDTSVKGIEELRFPAVDYYWYEKQEAIQSLDVRYKALWNVLLDIGTEDCAETLPEGTTMLLPRCYFPNFNKPFEDLIYPKGDPDAVSISKRDVDLLQPDTFVNDTIIDFYIKYLKNKLKPEDSSRIHFFNSFFFRKMADLDKDPSSAFDGKAAFQRVHKWTRKVNLLEKDFIFIPVNYNYHWSLIVICYFGEVADYKGVDSGKSIRVPCILHMDSIRGSHAGLSDLIQSYLWEEWKERQKEACEDLSSTFRNLKFVSLELPQQQNLYDCGLFLLHYVELFLEEVPVNFSVYKITSSSKFLNADWFPPGEASIKRVHIERLIYELLENHFEGSSPSVTTKDSGNDIEFLSQRTSPFKDFHGSLLGSRAEHGFEMTSPLPSSLRDTQCASHSRSVLGEFFEPGSASESLINTKNLALEQRASFKECKMPIHPVEEEVKDGGSLAYTSAETTFQNLDGFTPEVSVFPYACDFKLESARQAAMEHSDSSPATSVCDSDDSSEVEVVEKHHTVGEIIDDKPSCTSAVNDVHSMVGCLASAPGVANAGESCHPLQTTESNKKTSLEIYLQENELPSIGGIPNECLTVSPDSVSGEMLDVSESERFAQMLKPDDYAELREGSSGICHHGNDMHDDSSEKTASDVDVEHAAKRMRCERKELTSNLSMDLHL